MSIYQHFRPEEKPYIDKIEEWIAVVGKRQIAKLTDFLDPRQREILQSLVNRSDGIKVVFYGGYDDAERQRALIMPFDADLSVEEYKLALLSIENLSHFHLLEHRDYLGALLHLGVIRDKFGDLIVQKQGAQLIVADEMKVFIQSNLSQVGKAPVRVTEIPLRELAPPAVAIDEKRITVSSKRLDAIIAEIIHLSRSKVLPYIKAGKVKVNWKIADIPSQEIHEGDVISVRGFGRYTILKENGLTKKGNILLTVGMRKES